MVLDLREGYWGLMPCVVLCRRSDPHCEDLTIGGALCRRSCPHCKDLAIRGVLYHLVSNERQWCKIISSRRGPQICGP